MPWISEGITQNGSLIVLLLAAFAYLWFRRIRRPERDRNQEPVSGPKGHESRRRGKKAA